MSKRTHIYSLKIFQSEAKEIAFDIYYFITDDIFVVFLEKRNATKYEFGHNSHCIVVAVADVLNGNS